MCWRSAKSQPEIICHSRENFQRTHKSYFFYLLTQITVHDLWTVMLIRKKKQIRSRYCQAHMGAAGSYEPLLPYCVSIRNCVSIMRIYSRITRKVAKSSWQGLTTNIFSKGTVTQFNMTADAQITLGHLNRAKAGQLGSGVQNVKRVTELLHWVLKLEGVSNVVLRVEGMCDVG